MYIPIVFFSFYIFFTLSELQQALGEQDRKIFADSKSAVVVVYRWVYKQAVVQPYATTDSE